MLPTGKVWSFTILLQSSRKRLIRCNFTPTFGFVRIHFPAKNSNLRQFFSAGASQTP